MNGAVDVDDSAQIRDAEDRAELLGQQRNSLPVTIETQSRTARNHPLMDRLKGLVVELENKRTELLTKYEPGYRLVQEVEKQIGDTRAALEREQAPTVVEQTESLNPLHQSTEAELLRTQALATGLRARRESIAQEVQRGQTGHRKLNEITAEHDDLLRQVKIAEENYLLYLKKQEESRIADAMDQHKILNVAVVEWAVPPPLPSDRYRPFLLALGLLSGLLAGIGSALTAEHRNRAVSSLAEVQELTGLPVVATLTKSDISCFYSISR